MQVKVLGAGCANCHRLEEHANAALEQLGSDDRAEMVTDFAEIGRLGVMTTPALVIDEEVVVAGRVPEIAELVSMLGAAAV